MNITYNVTNITIEYVPQGVTFVEKTYRLVPLSEIIFHVVALGALIWFLHYSKNKTKYRAWRNSKGKVRDWHKIARIFFYFYIVVMLGVYILQYFVIGQDFVSTSCVGACYG